MFCKRLHTRVSKVVFIQILTIFSLQIIIIFIKLLCILMGTNVHVLTPDVLTEDVRKNVPGSIMFADDIVLCGDGETSISVQAWRRQEAWQQKLHR